MVVCFRDPFLEVTKESLRIRLGNLGTLHQRTSTLENRFEGDETEGRDLRESVTKAEAGDNEGLNSNSGTEDGQYDLFRCLVLRYLNV